MSTQSFNSDADLARFFTNVESLRETFKQMVATPTLSKHLIVLYGVGGVGKSSLLRMFRLHCKSVKTPVGLSSGDEAKSALDVLARWTDDLKADGVVFPSYSKTYEQYLAIHTKVDEQAKKAQDASSRATDIARKAASKTAEAAGGALAGAAIGSLIPGIGTAIGSALGGALGGMGAEALVDWLRGFLSKPDIDLLLDPTKKLTDDFLADLAKAAEKQRIVLMLDTFEQMTTLDDWARDIAQRLGKVAESTPGVLLVIAGRALLEWSRSWDSWMAHSLIEELKQMTEDDMRELVRRYYATMRGGEPDPAQVEAIIRFARGLPIVVTSVVQLWIKYPDRIGDLKAISPEVMPDLVDRLMEGVPDKLIPTLGAAAAVRWFDQPILRAVMGLADVREMYNELRHFPFVRSRAEGLALHDAVREIMDENLRLQDSERHCELHERAATYFEKRREKAMGEEIEKYELELLYHLLQADEDKGTQFFRQLCDYLANIHLVSRLRIVLGELNNHSFSRTANKLWSEYYAARLAELEVRGEFAEKTYASVAEHVEADPRLRAYALSDLGGLLSRWQYLGKQEGIERALRVLEKSVNIASMDMDEHLIQSLFSFAHVYQYMGVWDKSYQYLETCKKFYTERKNYYGLAYTYSQYIVMSLHMGELKGIMASEKEIKAVLSELPQYSYVKAHVDAFASTRLLAGRYAESENSARESLSIMQRLGDVRGSLEPMRWLSRALALQGKFSEAGEYCSIHLELNKQSGDYYMKDEGVGREFWGLVLMLQGQYDEARENFKKCLKIREKIKETLWIPTTLVFLAISYENQSEWVMAEQYYRESQCSNTVGRLLTRSEALAGILRIKYHLGDFCEVAQLIPEAEALAEPNEFNDHLASLRLTQGHLAWSAPHPDPLPEGEREAAPSPCKGEGWGEGPDAALHYYQHALVYALRFNRFSMDEVLGGRPQGTPLRPIIPHCLERGEEGRQMLIALREWWKTGVNDVGVPRPDTISPIPEGIPLLEAERIARQREPGDGSPQRSVIEQIDMALDKGEER